MPGRFFYPAERNCSCLQNLIPAGDELHGCNSTYIFSSARKKLHLCYKKAGSNYSKNSPSPKYKMWHGYCQYRSGIRQDGYQGMTMGMNAGMT